MVKFFRCLLAALFILVIYEGTSAQEPVKISKEKVSIEGVAYYIHIVQKGQTLYSISKAYNVSTEVLLKENRSAVYGLREGFALKIPVVGTLPAEDEVEKDNEKYIYHTLREGETIFALSRKYNIPEDQIRESNPHVDVFDLPVGTEIAIPRKEFMEQPVYFRTDDQGYRLHKVERGESMSDIAEKYNIPVRQLRNANRRMIFPKAGDYLRIPSEQASLDFVMPGDEVVADSALFDDENVVRLFDGTEVEYTPLEDLNGSVDVALLLPLYLKENSQRSYIDSSEYNERGKRIYKTIKRPDEWIFPRSELFLEYYEGVLLAVDELRSKGLSINLEVYDTRGDSLLVDSLLREDILDNIDLIIGPVYSFNVEAVGRYARRSRIPVVSPLASRNDEVLRNNPYLFKIQPGQELVEEAMAQKISDFYDYNLIFVHADTAWSASGSEEFKNNIFRKLRYVAPIDEINFRQVFFTSRSAYNDTINIIDHAMSREKPNLIIIASEDEAVMSEVLVNVHTLLRNYKIEVLGYPNLRWLENIDPEYFYNLGVMMFTPNWLDYNQDDVKNFIKKYRAKFNMEPQVRSYAWQSYDIAYYFISGIAVHGSQFKYHPKSHRPDLLQTDYDFSRTGITSGFENKRLFFIRFTPEMKVEFPGLRNRSSWE